MDKDEIVGQHHRFKGHKLRQTVGDGEGQGSLVCCSPWGHRVRHDLVTEQQPANQAGLAGRGKGERDLPSEPSLGSLRERERRGLKQGDGQVFFKEKQTT